MKYTYIFLLGILIPASVFAQTSQITGNIVDAKTAAPLAGAKIEINGNLVTTSDNEGSFLISCNEPEVLTFSYLGYETQLQQALCNTRLLIEMIPAANDLSEVRLTGIVNRAEEQLINPVSIVSLGEKELTRGTGLYLDDAINANVPGVTMQRRAVSSGQQFNIRGYGNGIGFRGANNNFDGQGYKVYLNGIPITDAEGITLMDDLDFGSVSDVEVIKGPAGSLYGLAIAGVVNLKTVQPAPGKKALSQSVTAGRYGLLRLTSQLQLGGENSSLLVNYGHQKSDGYMLHSDSQKDFVNMIMQFKPSDKQFVSTYFGYSNSYDERAGELSAEQFENKDYSGNDRYIKNNAHSEVISFRAGLSHTYLLNDQLGNTTTIFGSGISSNASSAGGWTDKDPINYGLRSSFDLHLDLGESINLSGVAGVELQQQRAEIIGYQMIENPDDPEGYNILGAFKSNQFAKSSTSSVFTEWVLGLPADFSITAGIGLSAMNIDLEDRLYNASSTKDRNVSAQYNAMYAPHFAINKVVNDALSIYASYSKGYKAPVSGNIVLSTSGQLNTGLVPEVGNQFEVGSKGNLLNKKLHYQLALFKAEFKDKFTSVAVPLDQNTTAYTYIANGGKQDHKGVEALVKYTAYEAATGFFSNVSPYANVTYSDFEYKDYPYETLGDNGEKVITDYSGNAVAGVAPWMGNAGVDFSTHLGLYGNLNYSYRDSLPFTSDGVNKTEAYNLLNAKVGYKTSFYDFDLDVFAGADNITGTQYYYMVFVNQLPDAYLPAPYETNFYAGASVHYNF